MKTVPGGVTAAAGFLAAGGHIGIKRTSAPDLALIVSERAGPVAGVFTTNRVLAAPVMVDRAHLKRKRGRAIVINSGNANACTGARGLRDARAMAALVARRLAVPSHTVFVCSTGVIGQFLPMPVLRRGIPKLMQRLSRHGWRSAARAILTTDTTTKVAAVSARIAGRRVTVGGMAKGSGMIHPDLATMLAFVTTDATVRQPDLQAALVTAVNESFNCISVDGDTSTNDTVLCLANGHAGTPVLRKGTQYWTVFQRMLTEVCRSLALQICRDGEGMTKLVRVLVTGARTVADARQVARTVATSALVKTALFGQDANWGRILAAVGRAGVPINQHRLGLRFEGVPIVRRGMSLGPVAERRIARVVRRKEFTITVDLGLGRGQASLWTTDLSYDYVRINAAYRT